MKPQARDERRISQEAAAWLATLAKGGDADREAFAAWVKESPRHVRAFLLMTALDIELDGIDADRRHELVMSAGNVVRLAPERSSRDKQTTAARLSRPMRWAAGLTAIVISSAIAMALFNPLGDRHYSTATGEQRTFELPDGSVAYLNTQSRIAVDFSAQAREIRLTKGEALFKVVRSPARPFRVRTGDAVIEVLGTQFNVRRDADGTKVSVIEGLVRIDDQTKPLGAGDAATIHRKTQKVERATADVIRTVAWRQRRLMFRTDTLADIAAEFNRYNTAPRIRIADEALTARRFSGVFDADDPESFAQVLEGNTSLRIERSDTEIVIRQQ